MFEETFKKASDLVCQDAQDCGVANLTQQAQRWFLDVTPEIRDVTNSVVSGLDTVLQDRDAQKTAKNFVNDTREFIENMGGDAESLDLADKVLDSKNSTEAFESIGEGLSVFDGVLKQVEESYREEKSTEFVANAVNVFREGLWNWGIFRKSGRSRDR